ncbi:DUF4892 domain-containing protein [Pseudomonas sp. RIT-PI-S]|uniref:DUF4892 domain-containing protein n=1 Tax=Pseudomonas sp. RIT-PI-S TaxID=3035295 RepID=UPI0021DACDC8|nr:DUF4892 domain-containing protein [Pseudomonas sp. RIT-PI-S]
MPYLSRTLHGLCARPWLRALLLPCLLLTLGATSAGASVDPLSALQPDDGQLLDQRGPAPAERLYPLGPLRRIGGALRMEARLQVRGELASATWELPAERSASAAFKVAREALRAADTQVLFWCEGRDCGESNLWANDILGNTRLLGSDDQQGFLLVRQAQGATDRLVAVYGVLRGNRRVALHVETFVPETPLGPVLPTSGTLLRELRDAGQLSFPDLATPPAADWASVLARTLNLDSTLRLRLNGEGAEQWQAALVAAGVRATRLSLGEQAGEGLRMEIIR